MVWDFKDVKNSSLKSSSRSTYLENSQCLEVPLRSYGECPWTSCLQVDYPYIFCAVPQYLVSFLPGDFRCIFILSPPGVTILAELILWSVLIRNFCVPCFINAPPRHFWNYWKTKCISGQHLALSRFYIHGDKN